MLVYLRGHEGRGIGIGHKIRAYNLQDQGHDTVDANVELGPAGRQPRVRHRRADPGRPRHHHHAAAHQQPAKYGGLEGFGLEIIERVPLQSAPNPENIEYLRTKRERMGHLLEGLDDCAS